jgi:hypothetical protein
LKTALETSALEKLAVFRKFAFRKTNPLTKRIFRKTGGFLLRPVKRAGGVNVGLTVDALLPITGRAFWKIYQTVGNRG